MTVVFAASWCKNKTVLDAACGIGYGSTILKALGAQGVRGMDLDSNVIEYAREHQVGTFDVHDLTKPIIFEDQYDVVVSMETFEHVKREDANQVLLNFKNACKDGGKIIISTPRRITEEFVYRGGTHLYEYDYFDFMTELLKVFKNIKMYYAAEFRHTSNPNELHTIFTDDKNIEEHTHVFIAVIST